MVDQQRFDELAKGLATNRLSRRWVLKGFAAGRHQGGGPPPQVQQDLVQLRGRSVEPSEGAY